MKKFLVSIFLASAFISSAQQTYKSYLKDNTSYREHPIDITRMKVEVDFKPKLGYVSGKVTHSFTVLQEQVDSIFFDAPSISITSAKLNGKNLPFTTVSTGIWVKPQEPLKWDESGTIVIEYNATPRKGIYFIGWNIPENPVQNPFAVRKQIWTQGQGIDNRYWIPMYDDMNDKFITETIVTFEKDYEVLSNGELKSKKVNQNNTITWHYAMTKPHPGYLLMLGIGKYDIKKTKSASGVPMNLYYYPEFETRAEPTYRYSEKLVDFLEAETGMPFPWESYSQIMVQDFMYGAMENTTATIFGDFFNVDSRAFLDRNYVGINCHELTHQWFGDCITARDGRDTWLQESYATYFPKIFARKWLGENEYDWQRRGEQNTALEASKKDKNPIRFTGAGTARVYQKGSAVISMLSYVLGDNQWKRALNYYLKLHAYGNVETNDLQQAIQDKLGKDLNWFFDQWILRGAEPEYTVQYEVVNDKLGSATTKILVQQTHAQDELIGLFKMPINFEVHYTDGTSNSVKQWIEQSNEVVNIPSKKGKKIAFVLFDPNSQILKNLIFKKEFKELKAQVLDAPNMLDRYDALIALKSFPIEKKRELLLEVLSLETFHQMKAEVVNQLINDEVSAKDVQKVFQLHSSAAKLAAIKGYNGKNNSWKNTFILALKDSSYDVVQNALEKLCQSYPEDARLFLKETKDVMGMNNSVNIKWHELTATYLNIKDSSISALINYTSPQWEFRTRVNAFKSLKPLSICNEQLITNLFDAMLSTNSRLAAPAAQLAEYLSQSTKNRLLIENLFKSVNWKSEEKDILKKSLFFL